MKNLLVALLGAVIGAFIALGMLFGLDTQVRADYQRCMEYRATYNIDHPTPCVVAVFTID